MKNLLAGSLISVLSILPLKPLLAGTTAMGCLYTELQLGPCCSDQEIRDAYRKLAVKFHPDANPGDVHALEKMKRINEAYETLIDPERRAEYDASLKKESQDQSELELSKVLKEENYSLKERESAIQAYRSIRAISSNSEYKNAVLMVAKTDQVPRRFRSILLEFLGERYFNESDLTMDELLKAAGSVGESIDWRLVFSSEIMKNFTLRYLESKRSVRDTILLIFKMAQSNSDRRKLLLTDQGIVEAEFLTPLFDFAVLSLSMSPNEFKNEYNLSVKMAANLRTVR